MKIKRNYGIRSQLCRECKNFMQDNCPVQKYNTMWIDDDSVLAGTVTLTKDCQTYIIGCDHYEKETFLSDYIKFLEKF